MTAEAPARKPRLFLIAVIILVCLLLLAVAAVYFLPYFLPMDNIRGLARDTVRKSTGMDLEFRSLGFSWTGGVVLEGITLSPPAEEGQAAEPLATVDEARADVALTPLLSGKIIINYVKVNGFSIRVRRDINGKMNLPDFSAIHVDKEAETAEIPVTTVETTESGEIVPKDDMFLVLIPAIELSLVELNNGTFSYDDIPANIKAEAALETFKLEGGKLEDPFNFSGRLVPFPSTVEQGGINFSGMVNLVKDLNFNPYGAANLQVVLDTLPLSDYAAQFGLASLLPSGELVGQIDINYAEMKGRLETKNLSIANVRVGLDGQNLDIPDSSLIATADYDYTPDRLSISEVQLDNSLIRADGQGWVGGIQDAVNGGFPFGEVNFNGAFNIPAMLAFGSHIVPDLNELSNVTGDAGFSGKWALGKSEEDPNVLATSLSVDLNEGAIAVTDIVPGVSASTNFGGIKANVNAKIAEPLEATANVLLTDVPLTVSVEDLDSPITANVQGGAAVQYGPGVLLAELRLQNSQFNIPQNQWSGALKVVNPELRVVADLEKDVVDISAADVTINDTIKAGIRAGRITGILAGNPEGSLDAELSMLFEAAKEIIKPLIPAELSELSGSLRAAARTVFAGGKAELGVNMEIDGLKAGYNDPSLKLGVESTKSSVGLAAGVNLNNPNVINLILLKADNSGLIVQTDNMSGEAGSARLGEMVAQVAGSFDADSMQVLLSSFQAQSNGLSAVVAKDGVQAATLTSGAWMIRSAATAEEPLQVKLGGAGEFNLREIEAGIDNLNFAYFRDGNPEESAIGNLRLKTIADGAFFGTPDASTPAQVNLQRLEFLANPVAAQARGTVRLDNQTLAIEYAARFAPERIKSLLSYLQIPPELITAAEVSGRLSWDGTQVTSAGATKGSLQFTPGEISPFSASHDLSASYSPTEEALHITIRGLTGGVASANGEAIVSLNAQPSSLDLSSRGANGFIDLRVNGAAAATRHMALGFASLIPEMRQIADMIQTTQADGIFNTWVQLQGQDNRAAILKVGGIWQGAAVTMNGTPFLAEPGRLGASIEGEYVYGEKRLNVSKLSFNSDTAQIRAEGNATAVLVDATDGGFGMSGVSTSLRFAMGDLTRVAAVFPGIIPPNVSVTGSVEGQFSAAGDTSNLTVQEGIVRLANIQARPGSITINIPQGNATFGGVFSLNPAGTYAEDGSDFVPLRMFNINGGSASLTGAQIEGRNVTDLSARFQLQRGVFTIEGARFVLSGQPEGTATASGTVDFNSASPAVNVSFSAVSLPLAQLSKELTDFVDIESGYVNVPASTGSAANVAFVGFSEQEILNTLRTQNLSFATGPVRLATGPVINSELDRARLLLRQEPKGDNSDDRIFTFQTISGTINAGGNGVISFPQESPIRVIGENTGDFAIYGVVNANRTIDLEAMVAGKLENILTFSLPSIIPNLRQQSADQQNQFMARMNQNAANGHYKLRISGPLTSPQISGIGELVARIITDIPLAAPFAVIGGVLNLGKDLPGAVLNAPQNITQGIGGVLGAIGGVVTGSGSQQQQQQQDGSQENEEGSQQQNLLPNLFRGLRR